MALSIAQKQNYLYISMVLFTIILTTLSYQFFEKKWLIYREAENKFNQKSFYEAIDLYQESLALGAISSQALLHLADSYLAVGNFSAAIKWYYVYLEIHPEDEEARHSLAKTLSWSGNIQEAEQEYNKLLKAHETQ